jgi:hypothetical protein
VGDQTHPRDSLGDEQPAVHARQPDRVDAEVAQAGDQLAVDDAAQDRRCNLERGRIGDSQPTLEAALDPESIEPFGDPSAATVDEDNRTPPRDRGDLIKDLSLIGDGRPS